MYKYVLVDLDDTLLDFKKSEKEAINIILRRYQLDSDYNYELFHNLNEEAWMRFQNGIIKKRVDFQIERFINLCKELNINENPAKLNEEYLYNLNNQAPIIDGAIEMLTYLSSKYELYCASNGSLEGQKNRLKIAGLDKYFKDVFTSSEIGYTKPDVNFFNYIFDRVSNKKEEFIIIGDNHKSDILGAYNANIDSVIVFNKSSLATYSINNLFEIKNVL